MPEGEVGAGGQVARAHALVQHLVQEGLGRHQAELVIERQFVQHVDTQRRQRVRPFGRQHQAEWRIVGAEHLPGMWLERQDRERGVRQRLARGTDDGGVAAMDAVEIAQGDAGSAGLGRQGPPVGVDAHQPIRPAAS